MMSSNEKGYCKQCPQKNRGEMFSGKVTCFLVQEYYKQIDAVYFNILPRLPAIEIRVYYLQTENCQLEIANC